MASATTSRTAISRILLMAMMFLTCGNLQGTSAELQDKATALEGKAVKLTIIIPDPLPANFPAYISIKLNNSGGFKDVIHILRSDFSIKKTDMFADRISVTSNLSQRKVEINLQNVHASDAGMFMCYPISGSTEIGNCGQMLVVIRKPSPPTISVVPGSSPLEGSDLKLQCEASSNSLPPNHGLPSEIWWYDQTGTYVHAGTRNSRISVNGLYQLVLSEVKREDEGLKFTCATADNAGDPDKRILSDKSQEFEVIPEFKPTRNDLTLTPDFENDALIRRKIGQEIQYKCEAECRPACDVVWTYKPHNRTNFGDVQGLRDSSILRFNVDRLNEGIYRCKAENVHGVARQTFELEALYILGPEISINGKKEERAKILENEEVSFKCVFDSNPRPTVSWVHPSPSQSYEGEVTGPVLNEANNRMRERLYTSEHTLNNLQCEDSGVYSCQAKNEVSGAEGRMDLMVTCPPSSSSEIPDLELKAEYVWEIPYTLNFKFVIRAVPEPSVTRIMSSLNGQNQQERIPTDVDIAKSIVNGKPYLTQFTFSSRRELTLNDMDREFTMTIESTEFKKDFKFVIQPRGPPHKVENLTAPAIGHNYVYLAWRPGFNGGEPQTFSIRHRRHDKNEDSANAQREHDWTLAVENVEDLHDGNYVKVKVGSLGANRDYVLQVLAYNVLGNATSEIEIKTAVAPDESLSGGAIAGIVIAMLIILVIIAAVLYYFLIYKKRQSKDGQEGDATRKPMLPERLTAFFKRDKDKNRQGVNGTSANDTAPKEGPMMRMKKLFKRKDGSSGQYKPAKDYSVSDDEPDAENQGDGDYINTDFKKKEGGSNENIYVNTPILNNNADSAKEPTGDKATNEKELVYLDLEFKPDKKKNGKDKKKQKKAVKIDDRNERVDYSDIDFGKTEELRQKQEAEEREKEEAARREEERGRDGDDDAPDGGANEEGDGNTSKRSIVSNEHLGTAV